MSENRSRFVLLCQQTFAVALVGAVAASAVGVTELEIVPPDGGLTRTLVSAAPVEPTVRSVPLAEAGSSESRTAAPGSQEIQAVSDAEPVVGYATVGVTWDAERVPEEADVTVEVRTAQDGVWSSWQEMHYDADHAPDPGSPEAPTADEVRNGTEPVVVGEVDDVQVRATVTDGEPLDGLELDIVDPGDGALREEAPAIDTAALTSAATAALSAGIPAKPTIHTRAQWGADEKLRDTRSLSYGKIRTGFVHHTVNANEYTKEQVPQIIRGIYAFHTKSRGWSDVGYNFLVDRFGRIWEGRYGGVDKAVVGAHTYGYNSSSFAMSAIGNFDTVAPTSAMVNAYGSLMAWKLALHGVDAGATKIWVNDRNFAGINGHRDAGSTACPGRYLYAKLPAIRSRAVTLQKNAPANKPPVNNTPTPKPAKPTTTLSLNLHGQAWPDLVVRDQATKRIMVVPTEGQLAFARGTVTTRSFTGFEPLLSPGDLTGDGVADVMVRSPKTGTMTVYAGTRTGGLGKYLGTTTRLRGMEQLTGVGDFNGDGRNDLVGRTPAKRLVLFPGKGNGTFGSARQLAASWSAYTATAGVDDFDGDKRPDLIARTAKGILFYPGTGTGLGRPKTLFRPGSSYLWTSYDTVTGRGDVTGDGHPDLLARSRSTGKVQVFPGDGKGALTAPLTALAGFEKHRTLTLADQAKADQRPDVVGVDTSNRLTVAAHNGRKNISTPRDTGVKVTGLDLLVNAGDWNGDGYGDVITRSGSSGDLHLRPGTKAGTLASPVTLLRAAKGFTRVAAVGDMNGDGWPDLVATKGGKDVVLPNVAGKAIGTPYTFRATVPGSSQAGVSYWDGDKVPDTVVRDGRTLRLWSSKTGKATKAGTLATTYTWLLGLGDLNGDGRADLVGRTTAGVLHLVPGTSTGFGSARVMGDGFAGYDFGS